MTTKEKIFLLVFGICFIISGVLIAGQLPIFVHNHKDIDGNPDDDSWKHRLDNITTPAPSSDNDTNASKDKDADFSKDTSEITSDFYEENTTISDENAKPSFVTVDNSYFDDALFIGDSRMEGIKDYSDIKNATFYVSSGLNVFKINKNNIEVDGYGKTSFSHVLNAKKYGKVYLMSGLNESGYKLNVIMNQYTSIVAQIRKAQPDSLIFLCANLHVSAKIDESEKYRNNKKLNEINEGIKTLADNKSIFYIDINKDHFNDENGYLDSNITTDGVHFLGKYYKIWGQWFREHGIMKK